MNKWKLPFFHNMRTWSIWCPCMFTTKMFKIAFWMKKHLSMTWKRTWFWSTSKRISSLDLGQLLPSERTSSVKTTKQTIGKNGKRQWQGTKALKGTQCFDCRYTSWMRSLNKPNIWSCAVYIDLRRYTYRFARNLVQLFPSMLEDNPHQLLPQAP